MKNCAMKLTAADYGISELVKGKTSFGVFTLSYLNTLNRPHQKMIEKPHSTFH
jgi:hypothetical protein